MLPLSNKPQIIRLHNLEDKERTKFCSDFLFAVNELFSPNIIRKIKSSATVGRLIALLPDLYYSLVTIIHCRRMLGEQYTYIAMYKSNHYEEQGVLLNRKARVLLLVLEIINRNVMAPLFFKFMQSTGQSADMKMREEKGQDSVLSKIKQIIMEIKDKIHLLFGSAEEIMANLEWFFLMLFMLNWNKHFTLIETVLGIRYVYTFKNEQPNKISYSIEGYLILATFIFKMGRKIQELLARKEKTSQVSKKQPPDIISKNSMKSKDRCRICYDDIQNMSSTKCGHIFCWKCIVKTLELSQQCPICRCSCLAREVVQLRNY